MMKVLTVSLVLVLVARATVALGQPRYYYFPYNVWYHHASTLEEGMARGWADAVRAAAEARLLRAEALRSYEEARAKYLENRLKTTKTYFEMRRCNRVYRDAERRPRPTQEDLIRNAKDLAPDRLSPAELDPLSGHINWPGLLKEGPYATSASKLDALFAQRARSGYISHGQMMEIQRTARTIKDELKKHVREHHGNVYVQAKIFIDGLIYESLLPTG